MKQLLILLLFITGCMNVMTLHPDDSYVLCGMWVTEDVCPETHNAQWIGGQCLVCTLKVDENYEPINFTKICEEHLESKALYKEIMQE